ncbi:hypothetical protein ANCCAN_00029 [Ancylostoma caninum]|uniref:Uncharacterized protein n=1 Tax=Ancylostoma caninum TaxID=29170 RepID=A0A368HAH2_ANCCA|nr:hypothetical protein ANCCAN_00029 [Ancylostoma caninum]
MLLGDGESHLSGGSRIDRGCHASSRTNQKCPRATPVHQYLDSLGIFLERNGKWEADTFLQHDLRQHLMPLPLHLTWRTRLFLMVTQQREADLSTSMKTRVKRQMSIEVLLVKRTCNLRVDSVVFNSLRNTGTVKEMSQVHICLIQKVRYP